MASAKALLGVSAGHPMPELPCHEGTASRIHSLQGDEYAAAVDKLRNLLAERQHAYAMADIQIPLETSPNDPGDVGAAPAIVAYR